MDHGVLVVNFAALQQAGADIQKALNTLDSQLGQLERDAAPLVASWAGEAQAGVRAAAGAVAVGLAGPAGDAARHQAGGGRLRRRLPRHREEEHRAVPVSAACRGRVDRCPAPALGRASAGAPAASIGQRVGRARAAQAGSAGRQRRRAPRGSTTASSATSDRRRADHRADQQRPVPGRRAAGLAGERAPGRPGRRRARRPAGGRPAGRRRSR